MTAPIRRRTRAREIAVQVLFQFDLRGQQTTGDQNAADEMGGSVAQLCRAELFADADGEQMEQPDKLGATDRELVEFAARLVEGTITHRESIDQRLQSVTRNWDLKRMAVVDRNVLRMAVYELLHCADVPPKVAINEAIEIGKKFSTANSGGFVNGILDRIRIDIEQERKQQRKPPASGSAPDGDGGTAQNGA